MISLKGNKKEVLRYLGYKGQALSAETERIIDEMLSVGLSLATPVGTYLFFDIQRTQNGILLADTDTVFTGDDISSNLKNAEKCAVMAVTVGAAIEKRIMVYEKSGEMTKAAVLDCVATALCEETADIFNEKIRDEAGALGFNCSPRFSPGYGDFPLETQRKIIPLLSCEKRIGVTLSETCLMSPRKSVTAVIGLKREERE